MPDLSSLSSTFADGANPLVLRPRRLRVVALVAAAGLATLAVVFWFALPRNIRLLFTLSQILTLVGFLAVLLLVIVALACSSVRADADGLRIRNALRVHTVPWSRVHKLILRRGDPWAFLLMTPSDGRPFEVDLDAEKRQLLAVQSGDGAAARAALAELRRRHERYLATR